jgi:hypothetical protein
MESLISNKSLLFGFIILLVINTVYRPRLPVLMKKMLNNAPFKIALITYFVYNSKYTIEFSLIVAVTILIILDMVREIEHFEVNDDKTNENTQADKSSEPNTPTATDSDSDASNKSTESKKSDKVINPPVSNPPVVKTSREIINTVPNVPSQVPNVPSTTPSVPKAPSTPTALQSNGMPNNTAVSSPSATTSSLGLSGDSKTNAPSNTTSAVVDTSDQTFVNKDTTNKEKKDTSSNTCKPNLPKLSFTSKVNEEVIVKILTNSALLSPSGKCKEGNPYETHLLLGNYKLVAPSEEDQHLMVPTSLTSITKEEKGSFKEINMIIRKGYKITIINSKGEKTFFGATSDEDGYYNSSDDIKKGLVDISEITVAAI